jgi:hypothetical protein
MGGLVAPLFRRLDRHMLLAQWLLASRCIQAHTERSSTLGVARTRRFSTKPHQPRRPRSSRHPFLK